jgi:hypothetical protein
MGVEIYQKPSPLNKEIIACQVTDAPAIRFPQPESVRLGLIGQSVVNGV